MFNAGLIGVNQGQNRREDEEREDGGRTYADRLFLQSAWGVCCSRVSLSGDGNL